MNDDNKKNDNDDDDDNDNDDNRDVGVNGRSAFAPGCSGRTSAALAGAAAACERR